VGRGSQASVPELNRSAPSLHRERDRGVGALDHADPPTTIVDNVFTTTPQKWEILKEYGRDMRKQPTPAEEKLWEALRGQQLAVKFRRQHAIDSYIVDFVTIPDKLIVEVDGDVHLEPSQVEHDAGRTHVLQELGYQVLRFTNEKVLHQLEEVLTTIQQHLKHTNETKRLRNNS
jgi:very-short-patch-repair endonuclease